MFVQFLLPLAALFSVKGDDETGLNVEKLMTGANAAQKTADKTLYGNSSKKNAAPLMSSNSHFEKSFGWTENRCRRLGTEYTACSRYSTNEKAFCIRNGQMCDGVKDCPYADDEDPTRCLFHRLSMDEMSRIRLAFSHLTNGMPRKQAILWTDGEGKARDQNGEFLA